MCGICGKAVFGGGGEEAVTDPLLEAITGRMVHRGPDGEGVFVRHYRDASVGLGQRRPSIIDPSEAGKQPMSNEDGTVWARNPSSTRRRGAVSGSPPSSTPFWKTPPWTVSWTWGPWWIS